MSTPPVDPVPDNERPGDAAPIDGQPQDVAPSDGQPDDAAPVDGQPDDAAPIDGRPDAEVLAAHVAGDPLAFGVLLSRHRDRLWAVALRTTGNPEDAADALQDALVSAFRQADSFQGRSAVTTWLHRIVVNASLDRLRRNRVRATRPLPEEPHELSARSLDGVTAPPSQDPEARALSAEVRDRVRGALAELPVEQAAALVLVDLEGRSVAEAADVLGVRPGTVKSRCSRGRGRLAELLADLVRDPDEPPREQRHGTGPAAGASHPRPSHDGTGTTQDRTHEQEGRR